MKLEDIAKIEQFSSEWWIEIYRCRTRFKEAMASINQKFWMKLMKNHTPAMNEVYTVIPKFREASEPVLQWVTNGFDLQLESISEEDKAAFFVCMKKATDFFRNGTGDMERLVIPTMNNPFVFTPEEQEELQERMQNARDNLAQMYWMMF